MNEVVVMEDGSPVPQEAVLVIRNEDIAQLLIQRYKEESKLKEGDLLRAVSAASKPIVKLYQKWVKLVYDEYMRTHGTELQALLTEINKFSTYTYRLSLKPKEKLEGWNGHGTNEGLSLCAAANLVDEHDPEVQKRGYYARDYGLKRYFNVFGPITGSYRYSDEKRAIYWTEGKKVVLKSKLKVTAPVERSKLTEKERGEVAIGRATEECKFPISLKPRFFEINVTDEMRAIFSQIQDVLNATLTAAKAYCENDGRTDENHLKEFDQRVRARITEHALQDLDIKEYMLSIYRSAAGGEHINLLSSDDDDDDDDDNDDDDFVETEEDDELDEDQSDEEVEDEEEDEDE
jgi:hypothetical protein